MGFLAKKLSGFRNRWKSLTYGILYFTSGDFSIPEKLLVNGKRKQLRFHNANSNEFRYEFTEICLNDCYHLRDLKKRIKNVNTILDIGANQGLFILAARQIFPKASIAGYEPNPELKELLSFNGHSLDAVVYFEAVTRQPGLVTLEFGHSDLHTKTLISDTGEIIATPLSKAIERAGGSIDILKMDCEGAEWLLLEDVDSWKKVKSVTMEYHLWAKQGSTFDEVVNTLNKLGFEVLIKNPINDQFGLLTAMKRANA
jgi:FkbM family methyltransferase